TLEFENLNRLKLCGCSFALKPVNFENSSSENSKRKQNFQSDFEPSLLTSRNPKTPLRQRLKTCVGKQC
ncbi:hypothetical protein BOO32_19400, partial [Vibrio navarrensis]|nr:hypothetical protein [Vibrio navarrensis]